jgi:MFS family permease
VPEWCATGSAYGSGGFAIGLCQSAGTLGNFIAVPLLTFLMLKLSWRWMFVIVGAAGIVLAAVWWGIHRDPAEVRLTQEEHRYLTEGDESTTTKPPTFDEWKELFAHRTTWGMIAGFFGTVYTLWLFTSWLPYYLENERHMSVARVGVVAAIPYLCGAIGAVVGGWLCDLLTRHGWTPMGGRKMLISSALCGISVCTVGTAFARADSVAIGFISLTVFLVYVASSASWATVPIAAPGQFTASLGSIQNCGGYLGGGAGTRGNRPDRAEDGKLSPGAFVKRRGDFGFGGYVPHARAQANNSQLIIAASPDRFHFERPQAAKRKDLAELMGRLTARLAVGVVNRFFGERAMVDIRLRDIHESDLEGRRQLHFERSEAGKIRLRYGHILLAITGAELRQTLHIRTLLNEQLRQVVRPGRFFDQAVYDGRPGVPQIVFECGNLRGIVTKDETPFDVEVGPCIHDNTNVI